MIRRYHNRVDQFLNKNAAFLGISIGSDFSEPHILQPSRDLLELDLKRPLNEITLSLNLGLDSDGLNCSI